MTLYIASNQIFSIHWATPFGEQEVEIMLKSRSRSIGLV
ncbi:hypothetical protein PVOR_25798 [Paenibacillus vortex V453]|jgi:hypothetical protein|uniref:Uncharacterized protein n=1 Tax=Paenibacillus vortex V453 TaxID=715225 RepID=A0A2R9SPH8_9BACL|nr:hypothetical protein PVOR_25798 [Paenibacillus vortex V453]ETT32489.1 aminoglycoside phosphotransferase [Paenibacillus sp. FSL R5-808]MDH6670018.1 hypothetical protein [Paenibacillus sp. LBL]